MKIFLTVLARLSFCLAFAAGGAVASAFAQHSYEKKEDTHALSNYSGTWEHSIPLRVDYGFPIAIDYQGNNSWINLQAIINSGRYNYALGLDKGINLHSSPFGWNTGNPPWTHNITLRVKYSFPTMTLHSEQGDSFMPQQPKDNRESLDVDLFNLKQKAKKDDIKAQEKLGEMYYNGQIIEKGVNEKAYTWVFLLGANRAVRFVRKIKDIKPNQIKKGLQILKASLLEEKLQKAVPELYFIFGKKYEEGDGVLPNYKEAAMLYRLAAEQGHIRARYRLGLMYLNGKSVARDYGEAYIRFALLAFNANGDIKEEATKQRQIAEKNLTTREVNQAQAEAAKRLEEIKKRQAAAQ